jgi:hypothetical protein
MVTKFIDALFGCWHSNYSFPITVRPGSRRNKAAALTGTYVVCLDCGKEFAYDWQEMRVVDPNRKNASAIRSLATKEAA